MGDGVVKGRFMSRFFQFIVIVIVIVVDIVNIHLPLKNIPVDNKV